MLTIAPIESQWIVAAKLVIATVAWPNYGSDKTVQTGIDQKRAIAFYKRIGFVEVSSHNEDPYDYDISLQIDLNN